MIAREGGGGIGVVPREIIARHRSRITILLVLCVVVYFLVAFGEQAWRARQLQAEASQLQSEIARLDTENAALQTELGTYATDAYRDYVQSRARRDLNLANPDETVLMITWTDPPPAAATATTEQTAPEREPNWTRWLDVFSGE